MELILADESIYESPIRLPPHQYDSQCCSGTSHIQENKKSNFQEAKNPLNNLKFKKHV